MEIQQQKTRNSKGYKYLGYSFTTGNIYSLHIKKIAAKTRKAINEIWGIWKRAGIGTIKDKMLLLDVIVRAGSLYGVEIWGWEDWKVLERVQARYVKMAMRLNVNPPDYIWEMKAGRDKLRVNNFWRAGKYLMEVGKMNENRWPQIFLKEEVRKTENGERKSEKLSTEWVMEKTRAFYSQKKAERNSKTD